MRKRRDPAAVQDDDGPKLITLQDKHEADRLLQQALAAGAIRNEGVKRRRGKAYAGGAPPQRVNPLGHRIGSPDRAGKALIWHSVRPQLAIVGFAAVIMMFVL